MAPAYYVASVSILAILVAFLPLAYKGWSANKVTDAPEQTVSTQSAQAQH